MRGFNNHIFGLTRTTTDKERLDYLIATAEAQLINGETSMSPQSIDAIKSELRRILDHLADA